MSLLISIVLSLCAVQAAREQEKASPGSTILKDFDRRVADYVKLHKTVRSKIPGLKPTKSAEVIEQHEHSLARGIRDARRGAVQGSIFTPEIAAQFRRHRR